MLLIFKERRAREGILCKALHMFKLLSTSPPGPRDWSGEVLMLVRWSSYWLSDLLRQWLQEYFPLTLETRSSLDDLQEIWKFLL